MPKAVSFYFQIGRGNLIGNYPFSGLECNKKFYTLNSFHPGRIKSKDYKHPYRHKPDNHPITIKQSTDRRHRPKNIILAMHLRTICRTTRESSSSFPERGDMGSVVFAGHGSTNHQWCWVSIGGTLRKWNIFILLGAICQKNEI